MAITRRSKKTSRGERKSIASTTPKVPGARTINVINAWRKGKNPWVTIPTPEKNKPFIRVRANDLWGPFKKVKYAFAGKAKA